MLDLAADVAAICDETYLGKVWGSEGRERLLIQLCKHIFKKLKLTTENSFFSPLNNEGDLSQECYANVKLEQIKFLELPHFQPAKVQILDNSALLSKNAA